MAGASRPRLAQTPALQEKWQREQLEAVPYFDGLMVGEHDALVESFAVHSGTDGLRVFYEQLFTNDGGIPLEHCALVDDGRACALEYNVVRWGRTELPPQAGVAVYVRGQSGKFAAARIYDETDPPL